MITFFIPVQNSPHVIPKITNVKIHSFLPLHPVPCQTRTSDVQRASEVALCFPLLPAITGWAAGSWYTCNLLVHLYLLSCLATSTDDQCCRRLFHLNLLGTDKTLVCQHIKKAHSSVCQVSHGAAPSDVEKSARG